MNHVAFWYLQRQVAWCRLDSLMKIEKESVVFSLTQSAASAVSTLFVLFLKGPACVIYQHLIAGDRTADNANVNQFKSKLGEQNRGLLYGTYMDASL